MPPAPCTKRKRRRSPPPPNPSAPLAFRDVWSLRGRTNFADAARSDEVAVSLGEASRFRVQGVAITTETRKKLIFF